MIRVVVAEDSLTVRELLVEILESDPEIQVVGQAKNGTEAVELATRLKPDLVTMDVHMPVMDGFAATKEIMVQAPTPILIVSSSASGRDVELSLNAMRAGALMVIAKPDDPRSARFDGRREELVAMAKAMARVKVVRRWAPQSSAAPPAPAPPLRPGAPVRLVAVAASTGGPAALQRILSALPRDFAAPILVVQHIAMGFVAGLAEWLSASCNLRVKVAEPGQPLLERTVLLAPDDRQLGVARDGRVVVADAPPVNGFRPSGTYLFTSAAQAYGASLAAVILTGMGSDGVEGLRAVRAAGGRVLAQDEASSVVYGMPAEAVAAGVVEEVLAVDAIAPRLAELVAGESHAGAHPRR
ncbi:MAG TPA: chemotaxis-specific protein-glutamate methyltransferase CheB [Gemmatimonadales bacterium]|nr:chemotaxis-specific protein-glutamate methyltransferase CheB [Gemmatimonadales bacterium]